MSAIAWQGPRLTLMRSKRKLEEKERLEEQKTMKMPPTFPSSSFKALAWAAAAAAIWCASATSACAAASSLPRLPESGGAQPGVTRSGATRPPSGLRARTPRRPPSCCRLWLFWGSAVADGGTGRLVFWSCLSELEPASGALLLFLWAPTNGAVWALASLQGEGKKTTMRKKKKPEESLGRQKISKIPARGIKKQR
jgi:hypothetical protein